MDGLCITITHTLSPRLAPHLPVRVQNLMKISPRGYWENSTAEGHGVDHKLAEGIKDYLEKETKISPYPVFNLLDLGCGTGFYSDYIKNNSKVCLVAHCYDGNPNTPELTLGRCKVADLSVYQYLGYYDWVLSLEVGEHIPEKYEHIFINNITRHARMGVILSWAIPGQGGDGHVNCRTNEYIRSKITREGLKFDINSTQFLRDTASPYPETGYWFKDTIMVFRRM